MQKIQRHRNRDDKSTVPQKETEQVGVACPYGDILVGFSNIIDLEKRHKNHIIAPEKQIIFYDIALLKINIYSQFNKKDEISK